MLLVPSAAGNPQGPMPNKVPGKLSDQYPVYLPTHATDAHQHAQAALRHSHAAMGTAHLDMALVRREQRVIEALAERFSEGAGALKGGKWRTHEARSAGFGGTGVRLTAWKRVQ
jgi:hypothetical protein